MTFISRLSRRRLKKEEHVAARIESFTDLAAHQRAFELSGEIFFESKRWPAEERTSLTSQIRRSSRSVGANIAEAWGKRRYEAHFVSKLTDADGENHETQHWLMTALQAGYLTEETFERFLALKLEVGRLLGGIIQDPKPFLLLSSRRREKSEDPE